MRDNKKVYSGLAELPRGNASRDITPGCLVLEGGAFRGIYVAGVCDALMEANLNLQCVVGVSAGALCGMNYVSGQIGRSARVNLEYRHDSRYVGKKAFLENEGVIGFRFLFEDLRVTDPFDFDRFFDPEQRFVAVTTSCRTGQTAFFEKGKCNDIFRAVQASASMPFVTRMVELDGQPHLDGGCSMQLAYPWALEQGFEKIVMVRTRHRSFRREIKEDKSFAERFYRHYPRFSLAVARQEETYNKLCNDLDALEESGRIFVIAPSENVNVGRLEKDMEKLGNYYYLGYHDAKACIPALKKYLGAEGNP